MRVLYLTTSLKEEDYSALLKLPTKKPNPSNQNFHSKLIKCFEDNDLQVISLLPVISKTKFINSGCHHYINYGSKWEMLLFPRHKEVINEARKIYGDKEKPEFIAFDSLSIPLGRAAKKLQDIWGSKTVAVITDNPANLSEVDGNFVEKVYEYVSYSNASIVLTEGLVEAFNLKEKQNLIIPGIVDSPVESKKEKYIYFGGALYERYGVANMIKGFLESSRPIELRIAGHGPLENDIQEIAKNYANLKYLGQVDKKENYALEAGSSLLINPRFFDETLDKESVPSKLLEYISLGEVVVSTPNSIIKKHFDDDINWIEDTSVESWKSFFSNHIDENGNVYGLKENNAKEKIQGLFGIEKTKSEINQFLGELNSVSS